MPKYIEKIFYGFKFEYQSLFYKKIGVPQFKKIVPLGGFWIALYNKLFSSNLRVIRTRESAIIWVIFTLSIEFLHLVGFITISWFTVQFAIQHNNYSLIKSIGINIIVNLYPILVQRYNRIRLLKTFNITLDSLKTFKIEL